MRRLVRQEMASASGTVFAGSFHDLDQVQERRLAPSPNSWRRDGLRPSPCQHVTSAGVKLEARILLISVLQTESTRGCKRSVHFDQGCGAVAHHTLRALVCVDTSTRATVCTPMARKIDDVGQNVNTSFHVDHD